MCQKCIMVPQDEEEVSRQRPTTEPCCVTKQVVSLKEKVTRTTQFLRELQVLSSTCQEHTTLDQNEDAVKERQVFMRRVMQVGAELQDARDVLLSVCKTQLPSRQWRLLMDMTDGESSGSEADFGGGVLSGFDLDPSVQFFGIDWERVFGRCFALSLNINILSSHFGLTTSELEAEASPQPEFDLLLINKILRDLAAIEADVTSHAEAVLRGRLSKSQQRLIHSEQLKYASHTPSRLQHFNSSKKVSKVSSLAASTVTKSRSFRDTSGKQRQAIRYRKNKTTNLDKLSTSASAHAISKYYEDEDDDEVVGLVEEEDRRPLQQQPVETAVTVSSAGKDFTTTTCGLSNAAKARKSSSTFMQNVSSIFKNIR